MSNKWEKHVSEPWFSLIKKGVKSVEGRLNKGDFAKMKKGDIVVWMNKNGKVRTKITSVHKYKSFNNYITTERLKNTLPDPNVKTIKQGVEDVYLKFYTKQDEKKYGVLAIRLKVIG